MPETAPHIDLISKGPSWVLCNLAVGAMEELEEEFPEAFSWTMVDASTRDGVKRLQELRPGAGRQIPVPGILVDGAIVFDRIPEMGEFTEWLLALGETDDRAD